MAMATNPTTPSAGMRYKILFMFKRVWSLVYPLKKPSGWSGWL
jgi:hypothetical protein